MQSVLGRLIERIQAAPLETLPSENIYMQEVFPSEIYSEILKRLPQDEEYDFIEHPDARLADGSITRKLLDLTEETIFRLPPEDQCFWLQMKAIFCSQVLQQAILNKFSERINHRFGANWPELVTVPIFYRDYPGYYISEHTDAPYKVATMQFYFPQDDSQIHLGTSFHLKKGDQFELLKTNLFKPNSAYAFVRTEESWHSVKQLGEHEFKRNTLALTIYEKGFEYKSNNRTYR